MKTHKNGTDYVSGMSILELPGQSIGRSTDLLAGLYKIYKI